MKQTKKTPEELDKLIDELIFYLKLFPMIRWNHSNINYYRTMIRDLVNKILKY